MTLRSLGHWQNVSNAGVYSLPPAFSILPDSLQAAGERWLKVQMCYEEVFDSALATTAFLYNQLNVFDVSLLDVLQN